MSLCQEEELKGFFGEQMKSANQKRFAEFHLLLLWLKSRNEICYIQCMVNPKEPTHTFRTWIEPWTESVCVFMSDIGVISNSRARNSHSGTPWRRHVDIPSILSAILSMIKNPGHNDTIHIRLFWLKSRCCSVSLIFRPWVSFISDSIFGFGLAYSQLTLHIPHLVSTSISTLTRKKQWLNTCDQMKWLMNAACSHFHQASDL